MDLTQIDGAALKKSATAMTKCVDVSNNRLTSLKGLEVLPLLEEVDATDNALDQRSYLPVLKHCRVLSLGRNAYDNLDEVLDLISRHFPSVAALSLLGNPCCPPAALIVERVAAGALPMDTPIDSTQREAVRTYRRTVARKLPHLFMLDNQVLGDDDRDRDHQAALSGAGDTIGAARSPSAHNGGTAAIVEELSRAPFNTTAAQILEMRAGDHMRILGVDEGGARADSRWVWAELTRVNGEKQVGVLPAATFLPVDTPTSGKTKATQLMQRIRAASPSVSPRLNRWAQRLRGSNSNGGGAASTNTSSGAPSRGGLAVRSGAAGGAANARWASTATLSADERCEECGVAVPPADVPGTEQNEPSVALLLCKACRRRDMEASAAVLDGSAAAPGNANAANRAHASAPSNANGGRGGVGGAAASGDGPMESERTCERCRAAPVKTEVVVRGHRIAACGACVHTLQTRVDDSQQCSQCSAAPAFTTVLDAHGHVRALCVACAYDEEKRMVASSSGGGSGAAAPNNAKANAAASAGGGGAAKRGKTNIFSRRPTRKDKDKKKNNKRGGGGGASVAPLTLDASVKELDAKLGTLSPRAANARNGAATTANGGGGEKGGNAPPMRSEVSVEHVELQTEIERHFAAPESSATLKAATLRVRSKAAKQRQSEESDEALRWLEQAGDEVEKKAAAAAAAAASRDAARVVDVDVTSVEAVFGVAAAVALVPCTDGSRVGVSMLQWLGNALHVDDAQRQASEVQRRVAERLGVRGADLCVPRSDADLRRAAAVNVGAVRMKQRLEAYRRLLEAVCKHETLVAHRSLEQGDAAAASKRGGGGGAHRRRRRALQFVAPHGDAQRLLRAFAAFYELSEAEAHCVYVHVLTAFFHHTTDVLAALNATLVPLVRAQLHEEARALLVDACTLLLKHARARLGQFRACFPNNRPRGHLQLLVALLAPLLRITGSAERRDDVLRAGIERQAAIDYETARMEADAATQDAIEEQERRRRGDAGVDAAEGGRASAHDEERLAPPPVARLLLLADLLDERLCDLSVYGSALGEHVPLDAVYASALLRLCDEELRAFVQQCERLGGDQTANGAGAEAIGTHVFAVAAKLRRLVRYARQQARSVDPQRSVELPRVAVRARLRPLLLRWITDTTKTLEQWTRRAVAIEQWTPQAATLATSASVTAVFGAVVQALNVLRRHAGDSAAAVKADDDEAAAADNDDDDDEEGEAAGQSLQAVFGRVSVARVVHLYCELLHDEQRRCAGLRGDNDTRDAYLLAHSYLPLHMYTRDSLDGGAAAVSAAPGAAHGSGRALNGAEERPFDEAACVRLNDLEAARTMLADLEEQMALDEFFNDTLSFVRLQTHRYINVLCMHTMLYVQPTLIDVLRRRRRGARLDTDEAQATLDALLAHLDAQLALMSGTVFAHLLNKYAQRLWICVVALITELVAPTRRQKRSAARTTAALLRRITNVAHHHHHHSSGASADSGALLPCAGVEQAELAESVLRCLQEFLHADGAGLKRSFFQRCKPYARLLRLLVVLQSDVDELVESIDALNADEAEANESAEALCDATLLRRVLERRADDGDESAAAWIAANPISKARNKK